MNNKDLVLIVLAVAFGNILYGFLNAAYRDYKLWRLKKGFEKRPNTELKDGEYLFDEEAFKRAGLIIESFWENKETNK